MIARWLLVLWLAVLGGAGLSQEEPFLRVELPEAKIIVGQPSILRLTVLVPTWMTAAPVYPDFEVPGLLVRLPSRATAPLSERIGGDTWSGTTRAYRLYPLQTGTFEIPASILTITWADPKTRQPIGTDLPIPQIRFTSVLPAGAASLDPPIVAQGFTLEQDVEGETDLAVGGAVTRRVTARIDGTTPILIPQLQAPPESGPLRAYPSEPEVTETENRGTLSGRRIESVTYVAQAGGTAELPEIRFDWFDLGSNRIETAAVPAIRLRVAPPPRPPPDPLALTLRAAVALVIAAAIYLALRLTRPHLRRLARRVSSHPRVLEWRAHRRVTEALRRRDLGALLSALDGWRRFYPYPDPDASARLGRALSPLGAARYGRAAGQAPASAWRRAEASYLTLRQRNRARRRKARRARPLPALNPRT